MTTRRAARGLLLTEALLLLGTLPVLGFAVVWGSVWEGSPEALARRRSGVHWLLAAGAANALAVVLVLVAASQVDQPRAARSSAWAAAWVGGLGIAWLAVEGPGTVPLGVLLVAPALLAAVLVRRRPARAVAERSGP